MKEHYTIAENEDLITKFDFLKDMLGCQMAADTNMVIKGVSPDMATPLGWHNAEKAINEPASAIPSQAIEALDLFYEYKSKVSLLQKKVGAIQVFNDQFGILILLVLAIPIIDNNNLLRGIFYSSTDLTEFMQRKYNWIAVSDDKFINYKSVPKQYILTPEASPLPLSHRQQECLALLIRGKTYKEIAYMLNVSDRTIEDHIHAIKYKLGCYSKSQLIEKAIDSGFLFHIPETLLGLLR